MFPRRHPPRWLIALAAWFVLGGGSAAGREVEPGTDAARVLAIYERAVPPEQMCEIEFLRHLGWRFVVDAGVDAVMFQGGRPGRHATIAAVHAAGGLTIRVPERFDAAMARASARRLVRLADGIPSRLAYRHKLVGPVRRATKRLADMTEAGRHVFPEIFELFHSPTYRLHMPLTEWTLRDRMYFATRSSAHAMEAFYRLGSTAECYVGQLLALYSIQYELLGRDWFHRLIPKDELVVGRPTDVIKTPLLKNLEYEVPYDWRCLIFGKGDQQGDPLLKLAPHGPIAFTGCAGVVLNQSDSCFTQDNIVFRSVSQAALDQIVRGGGLEYFDKQTARIWEIGNDGKGLSIGGIITIGGLDDDAEKQIDAILEEPMFSEIEVYVHPDGIVPLGDTVKKFVTRTESPVTLRINMNGLDDELYRRYRRAFVEGCLAQRKADATSAGSCPRSR